MSVVVRISWTANNLGLSGTTQTCALRQRMAEEEAGAWGSVDTRDVIVRLTGQQTNHATCKQ